MMQKVTRQTPTLLLMIVLQSSGSDPSHIDELQEDTGGGWISRTCIDNIDVDCKDTRNREKT